MILRWFLLLIWIFPHFYWLHKRALLLNLCVSVCFRPPARGLCPNYEVVEFQPRTGIPPEPRLYCEFLRTCLLDLPLPLFLPPDLLPGGQPPPALTNPPPTFIRTGSSAHMGFTCLRPSIPMLPDTTLLLADRAHPSDPTLILSLLPDSCFRRTLLNL